MNAARAILTVIVCALVLSVITRELNHAFSWTALAVFTAGLPVAFAGLRLDFSAGWKTAVLLGLLADALAPVHFGVHAIAFLITFLLIFRMRQRVPRDETLVGTVFAIASNGLLYTALSLVFVWRNPAPDRMVGRLFSEAGLSTLLVLLLAPWFFALCTHALTWAGVDLRREQRSLF
ncbi:hypothetical protein [Nibricoccus sp. IMCC34717]|uniref:hypothetical protein n=1 Tax=Nibricoccus sp. IMCC34717 TaxID=3034021 RepID=UPI00384C1275